MTDSAPPLPVIFCALDTADLDRALTLAAAMQRADCGIKLGLEFFSSCGPEGVKTLRSAYPDLPLFLDLKFHDIPHTVAAAIRAVTILQPDFVNVHAAGGEMMMQAAHEASLEGAHKAGVAPPRVLAVTILTSMDDQSLRTTGYAGSAAETVPLMARLAQKARLDGVVCSAHEIALLREHCGPDFTLMVPGIRPGGSAQHDQKRVMTPEKAVAKGADHLVIGRPITGSDAPEAAARIILESLKA